MHANTPLVYVALDKRRMSTTGINKGKYHIKVWVIFKVIENGRWAPKQIPYVTNLFATAKDYKAIVAENKPRRTDLMDIRTKLRDLEKKANKLIEKYEITDQKKFELYYLIDANPESVKGQYDIKIKKLLATNPPKISSAEKYKTSWTSLSLFFGEGVTFQEITPERLTEYENDYVKNGKSLTSVGFNLRCLRHVFRQTINDGIISEKVYPFGIGGYIIPEGGDSTKQYLESNEKEQFSNFRFEDDSLNELLDYAIFSYYANGLNFSDIARLKKYELKKDYISKERQKTKGRKKKIKMLIIPIHLRMAEIIERRGNKGNDPNEFVFPILMLGMTEAEMFKTIRKFIRRTNEVLSKMAEALEWEIKPTTYTLRHTFSKTLIDMGASTEELQDALAHGSKSTTENYKHGFSLERKKKLSDGL